MGTLIANPGAVDSLNSNFFPYISNNSQYTAINLAVAQNSSYEIPETGVYAIMIRGDGTYAGAMYLDSNRTIVLHGSASSTDLDIALYPLKKGTTLYTRAGYGVYKIVGRFN